MTPPRPVPPAPRAPGDLALITGGAGFVATNVADRLLRLGYRVRLFDNLSRKGVEQNVDWLCAAHPGRVELVVGDVRDAAALATAVDGSRLVFHFAAQVAVTTSLEDPLLDFDVNARSTLHLLEMLRALDTPPSLLFASTNTVYGDLADVPLEACGTRYVPADAALAAAGIGEDRPLDFHSPYGCSKGAADQYVLDYARTFGLPAAVFRMSCIYGPHQFGTEDQGWVAHFVRRALEGRPLTVYGDGLQVRDILFVEDLVDAMLLAHARMPALAGRAFNIGGGPARSVSLLELRALIGDILGRCPDIDLEPWRPADQRYYVSDTSRFTGATGWRPSTPIRAGLERLVAWLAAPGAGVDPVEARAAS
jgi:CDP-paratose 2-epimerase